MKIPISIIDIDPIKRKLNVLIFNSESLKQYGSNLQVSKQVFSVFDLTINYIKALCDDTTKYELYSKSFAEKISKLIDFEQYKSGDNIFIDSCLGAINLVNQVINQEREEEE